MTQNTSELKFSDDIMFCMVMQENEDICKGVVERILGFEIGGIVKDENQKSIEMTEDGHGVRFDIFMKDDTNKVYDIEMQTSHYSDIGRRSRYYQSMLDRTLLRKGSSYRKLNDSYIIFILLKDVFGLGYNVYEFESLCTRDGKLSLNDGAKRIFINAESVAQDSSPELQKFISYMIDGKPRDKLTERIEESVVEARINPWMEGKLMTLWEMKEDSYNEGIAKGIAEGKAEGIAEGEEKKALEIIPEFLKLGLSVNEACEKVGISNERYCELTCAN